MYTINERISKVRECFCAGNNKSFAMTLGKQPNTTSNWTQKGYSVGRGVVSEIADAFPSVDKDWLLTGKGEMLKKDDLDTQISAKESENSVLLLPISAQGGSLSNFAESVSAEQCERIVSPIKDVSFAMSVTGDSMEPEYPSGSKILIKKINERAFIEWGRCYVLDTCNGTVVKKLMPSDNSEKLKCVSTNIEYPPFDVYLTDIFGVYRVLMMLAEK